ncbi:MAG: flippase-like domain-containing protein [Acidobacteria bacterium]|nr:flippase-like domain-containing protein [Acidobacteriota bacterium]
MIAGIQIRFDRKTWISLAVAMPLAAALLWLALRNIDLAEVWEKLKSARGGWFAVAVAAQAVALVLRAIRWRALLNAEGALSLGTVFSAMSAGYLGNNIFPARMGELIRTAAVSWSGSLSLGYVFATAMTERLIDAAALLVVASTALSAAAGMPEWLRGAARGLALVSGAGILAIIALPRLEMLFLRLLRRVPLGKRAEGLASQFVLGLRALHNPARAFQFLGLTAIIWPLDGFMALVVGWSLEVQLGFPRAMLLIAALGLSSAIPSTPGYVGVYQFAAVTVLSPLGVAKADALAVVLLVQAAIYLVMTVAGLAGIAALNRLRSQTSRDSSSAQRE